MFTGFPGRLDHVGFDPFHEPVRHGSTLRPGPDQGLVQEVLRVFVGNRFRSLPHAVTAGERMPGFDPRFPFRRYFGQYIQSGPHVFTPLRVMGRGAVHGMGPVFRPSRDRRVKPLDTAAEAIRRTADLVQGNEPIIPVEGRVFEAFGHQRRRQLLERPDGPPALFEYLNIVDGFLERHVFEKQVPEKLGFDVQMRIFEDCSRNRRLDDSPVFGATIFLFQGRFDKWETARAPLRVHS